MTIQTRSAFLYGYTISSNNFSIDFTENGIDELQASIAIGTYTFAELASAIALALNTVGGQEYTVTFDRDTRHYNISSIANFDLLISSGTRLGVSAFSTMGFTGSDLTGLNTYESDSETGTLFEPQFFLQDYVDFEDFQQAQQANVNISTSNAVEVVSFGLEKFMECNITFQNDIITKDGYIEADNQGVLNLRNFLSFATSKGRMEFYKDRSNRSNSVNVILEKTSSSSIGVGFKMKELINRSLAGYFESGKLTFREV